MCQEKRKTKDASFKKDHSGLYSILENVALHKNAWQLHPYENTYQRVFLNASNAVDGLKQTCHSLENNALNLEMVNMKLCGVLTWELF